MTHITSRSYSLNMSDTNPTTCSGLLSCVSDISVFSFTRRMPTWSNTYTVSLIFLLSCQSYLHYKIFILFNINISRLSCLIFSMFSSCVPESGTFIFLWCRIPAPSSYAYIFLFNIISLRLFVLWGILWCFFSVCIKLGI